MDPKNFSTTPDITTLPTTCAEAAAWIWDNQDRLNALSLRRSDNLGTVEIGDSGDKGLIEATRLDYRLALQSEVTELIDNRFWKHWSKEAKAGKRFQLVCPEGEKGDGNGHGTHQNELVEITDIAFFSVSLMQVCGFRREFFVGIYGDPQHWSKERLADPLLPQVGMEMAAAADRLSAELEDGLCMVTRLLKLWRTASIPWEVALSLYAQKLVENYRRQLEGRSQFNDAKADEANLAIKA